MTKTLCKGPFALLLHITLGGVVTSVVLFLFRLDPTWDTFLALFLACCLSVMLINGLIERLVELRHRSRERDR